MTKDLYVVLAPIALKDGVDETALVAASDAFDADFASKGLLGFEHVKKYE